MVIIIHVLFTAPILLTSLALEINAFWRLLLNPAVPPQNVSSASFFVS
jgi:hypothetical protein